jgi:hypothetical protein
MLIKYACHAQYPATHIYRNHIYWLHPSSLAAAITKTSPNLRLIEGGPIRYFYSTIGWPNMFEEYSS